MYVTHKLRLDLIRRELTPRVDVVQDDRYSRNLAISLYENRRPFCPGAGCGILIRFCKSDGTSGAYDTMPDGSKAWTMTDNLLTIRLAPQVCTVAGPVHLTVSLTKENAELSSFGLQLDVQKLPGGVKPSREYINITHFLPQAENAAAGQYLRVKAVNAQGNISALESTELPDNVVTCDSDSLLEAGGQEVYPLTKAEKVIMDNGERLNVTMEKHLVPTYASADYGKFLTCGINGLVWTDARSSLTSAEEEAY